MGTIAEGQIKESIRSLKIGDIHYQYRKVSSADIADVGGGFLLALRAKASAPSAGELTDVAKKERIADLLKSDPALLGTGSKFNEAVVCASVFAASRDGTTWEPYRLVLDIRHENGPAGRAHISVLGNNVGLLAKAVMALTNGEGLAGDGAASFPGGTPRRAARARRPRRQGVPE